MQKLQNISLHEDESDIKIVIDLVSKNYKIFLFSVPLFLIFAFLLNSFMLPTYKVSSSMLIKEESKPVQRSDVNDYLNSSLFGGNRNFQNELWVLKSSPVISETVINLNLPVTYYLKKGFQYVDVYETTPFQVLLMKDHLQPVNVRFQVSIQDDKNFHIKTKPINKAFIKNLENGRTAYVKDDWVFEKAGKFGELIETPDLAFVLQLDTSSTTYKRNEFVHNFVLSDVNSLTYNFKQQLELIKVQKEATVVEISLKSHSLQKGIDIINELMNVYSKQELDRKNHLASITIDYIEKQLGEISDSLSQTEDNLQNFRSSRQLLNLSEQTTGISSQYRELQNQMAELVTRKRYYDYVSEYLANKDDFSEMIVPASMGIQDPLLNTLMSELISAQAQRSNLIQNQQERNPLVQKLSIQIENTRKTITENIAAVRKTTDISIDEMNKRINKVEAEISRIPRTQRQLGGIERKFRLNDAIYNYMLEKRAEAKITQASNLPDNIIIEPANLVGTGPLSPYKRLNYLIAIVLGLAIPFSLIMFKGLVTDRIESQENLERITEIPVLGKIMHNNVKTNNVVYEYPKSTTAEAFRVLRTNIEFHFRGIQHKVIMVTSSIEGEGKSYNSLNIAMSYAQLKRRTILVNFDLRKPSSYFVKEEGSLSGLSSFYSDKVGLEEIICHSPHEKLDYIPAGPIPPDPIELISTDKTKEIFEYLKEQYDCIVLDTTPLAQVSDAYLLMDFAQVKIIVARHNYTLKKVFSLVMKDLKQKNINNTCIVLNDNRFFRDQYGYGYGYNKKKKKKLL